MFEDSSLQKALTKLESVGQANIIKSSFDGIYFINLPFW